MDQTQTLLIELDGLKRVLRRSYISDGSRHENSAEHSWHVAVALLALRDFMPASVDLDSALRIALLHDVGEVGASDISIFDWERPLARSAEENYLASLAQRHGHFGSLALELWREYEDGGSLEGHWVRLVDRLLPFLLNLATEGKSWREQGINRTQVLEINRCVADTSEFIYNWMIQETNRAVELGWLKDA